MALPLSLLFLTIASIQTVVAQDCNTYPISLPIQDVALSNNGIIRGVPMKFGSNQQQLSLVPDTINNVTWFFDKNIGCPGGSAGQCPTLRGGSLDAGSSSSFKNQTGPPAEGTDSPTVNGTYASDNLQFLSNFTVNNHKIGLANTNFKNTPKPYNQHAIGLGLNSTLLNVLKTAGTVYSKTWSMWYGITGAATNQMDGSLVLGGYDKAKVKGTNASENIVATSACSSGLQVTVSEIMLNFPNGTNAGLFARGNLGNRLAFCIYPDYPFLMSVPLTPYWTNFESLTNTQTTARSFGLNFYTMLFTNPATAYQGNLTIQLDNGLNIPIRNDQFVVPDLVVNNDGSTVSNGTVRDVLINSLQSTSQNDMPILGRTFLTGAYLMVNQDSNTFTMWQANPSKDTNLVAVGSNPNSTCGNSTAQGQNNGGNGKGNTSSKSSSISGGAIAGIVIGVLALLALLALGALFFLRRRRNAMKAAGTLPGHPGPHEMNATETGELAAYGAAGHNQEKKYYDNPQAHGGYVNPNAPVEAPTDQHPVEMEAFGPGMSLGAPKPPINAGNPQELPTR